MCWRPRLFFRIPSRPPPPPPPPRPRSLFLPSLSQSPSSRSPSFRRSTARPLALLPSTSSTLGHVLAIPSPSLPSPAIPLSIAQGPRGTSRVSLRPSCGCRRGGGPLAAARCHAPTSSPLPESPHSLPFPPLRRRFTAVVIELNLLQQL
jgi:hypothetical protein